MKNQVRLTKPNLAAIEQLQRDAKLNLLTLPAAANLAIEKGISAVRRQFVKPKK